MQIEMIREVPEYGWKKPMWRLNTGTVIAWACVEGHKAWAVPATVPVLNADDIVDLISGADIKVWESNGVNYFKAA